MYAVRSRPKLKSISPHTRIFCLSPDKWKPNILRCFSLVIGYGQMHAFRNKLMFFLLDMRVNPNVTLQYRTKAASFPSSCRTEQRSVFNMLADLGQAQPHLCTTLAPNGITVVVTGISFTGWPDDHTFDRKQLRLRR